jgi:hypothetical protein
MKKTINLTILLLMAISVTSCATLFGGKISQHQKTQPGPGEQQRQIRPVALVADLLLFWPSLIVDFATGAIYKPYKNGPTLQNKKVKDDGKMY